MWTTATKSAIASRRRTVVVGVGGASAAARQQHLKCYYSALHGTTTSPWVKGGADRLLLLGTARWPPPTRRRQQETLANPTKMDGGVGVGDASDGRRRWTSTSTTTTTTTSTTMSTTSTTPVPPPPPSTAAPPVVGSAPSTATGPKEGAAAFPDHHHRRPPSSSSLPHDAQTTMGTTTTTDSDSPFFFPRHNNDNDHGERTTHFGYRTVAEHEKEKMVGNVFRSVATSYDMMNDVMSMGIHRYWKQTLIERLAPGPETQLLDVAGGTGDIAQRFLLSVHDTVTAGGGQGRRRRPFSTPFFPFPFSSRRDLPSPSSMLSSSPFPCAPTHDDERHASSSWKGGGGMMGHHHHRSSSTTRQQPRASSFQLGSAHVTVFDINPAMLQVGKERFQRKGLDDPRHVTFMEGNAETLEGIPDASMDAYTIAFGIRNCTHMDRVLQQAYRVLRPGGRILVLEFGKVGNPLLSSAYETYSFQVVPHLGQILANDRDAYQYLAESIRRFPTQPEFAQLMRDQGFRLAGQGYEDLTFGIATIWSGWKF